MTELEKQTFDKVNKLIEKNKQIEEMAKFICNACEMGCDFDGECAVGNDYKKCGITVETAQALYNAGYRKASDVAKEIIGILKSAGIDEGRYPVIAELKKKYTEGEE